MMRIAWIVLLLAGVGVGLVQLRSRQAATRAEMFRLEARRLKVRRKLWEQQLRLSEPAVPRPGRQCRQDWALDLIGPGGVPATGQVAQRD